MTAADRRTEEELFLLFRLLTADARHQLEQIVTAYYAGSVTTWQLSDALVQALSSAHAHAAYLGRRLAGNRAPFGTADQQFAASIVIGQGQYLRGLVSDILTGRYPPKVDGAMSAALANRLVQYALRLRGTANEMWALSLPAETLIDWVLGPTEHCTHQPGFPYDCVQLAQGGPYPASALPTYPGACDTPCLFNCGCDARTRDGASGFSLVDLSEGEGT